jgi:large repetitive protein
LTALSITNTNPRQGSAAAATWSVQSGNLPAGVTLSSSGVLSGTPTAEGSYTFVVRAVAGGVADTETETLVVRQPIAIVSSFAQRPAPKAEVGVPFTAQHTASGGEGTFTWSIAEGALPAGLVLGPDGTITGTPTLAGRFVFAVVVTDRESRTSRVNATLVVAPKLAIKTLKLKPAKVARAYRAQVAKVGGVAPLVWTIRGKLPKGLKFSPKLGLFLGTPSQAGTFRVTVQAVDALGVKAQKTLTLKVGA